MVGATLSATTLSAVAAAGALGLLGFTWAVRWPRLALSVLGLSIIVGQVIRLPLPGQGGGLLLSDGAVVLVLVVAAMRWPRTRRTSLARFFSLLYLPFLLMSLLGLVAFQRLTPPEFLIAFSYWVRLTAYLLVTPALLVLCREAKLRRYLVTMSLVTVTVLLIAGLMQVWLLPDLSRLSGGWDPHQGRLVATWLDPNFIGLFWVIVFAPLATAALKHRMYRLGLILLIIGVGIALGLTASRSSFLAAGVAALAVLPLITIRLLLKRRLASLMLLGASVGIGVILILVAGWILGERAWGIIQVDATASLRWQSWRQAWELMRGNEIIGVGYNAYQFSARDAGQLSNFHIHSRGGAESSWLTLGVTTGLIGLIAWCVPWLWLTHVLIRQWLFQGNLLALASVYSLLAIAIHAQFVNSFLYGHILLTIASIIALALSPLQPKSA